MSFIWFRPEGRLRTPEQVAKVIYDVAVSMGLDEFYAHCALACVAVESDYWCPWNVADPSSQQYPFDSQSNDGRSVGYYQQQNGAPGPNPSPNDNWWGTMVSRMSLDQATRAFLSRMPDGLSASTSVYDAGQAIANTQQCAPAYRGRYAEEWDAAGQVLANALKVPENGSQAPVTPPPAEEPAVADSKKPAFNEFAIWSPNNEARDGLAPKVFLLHTQQPALRPPPDNAAESLGNYCADPAPQVSYHYYISQASDGGVTLVDGVDTDMSSWSVGNDNHASINLCFAGSGIEWTRDEWMKYAGNAIDVAAYVAAQDVKKYPTIASKVIGFGGNYPGSTADDSGIADHRWVTDIFGWGDHKDVGSGFPGDYFTDRFNYWLAGGESQAPPPVVAPPVVAPPAAPVDPAPTDAEGEILAQTRGRWERLGWQTPVEALAELRDHILGTSDKDKAGFRW